jgi:hypothetical protein
MSPADVPTWGEPKPPVDKNTNSEVAKERMDALKRLLQRSKRRVVSGRKGQKD